MVAKTPPWKRKKPAGKRTKLTAASKDKARARAHRAGRRYPNLVDNMWAAKQQASPATSKAAPKPKAKRKPKAKAKPRTKK